MNDEMVLEGKSFEITKRWMEEREKWENKRSDMESIKNNPMIYARDHQADALRYTMNKLENKLEHGRAQAAGEQIAKEAEMREKMEKMARLSKIDERMWMTGQGVAIDPTPKNEMEKAVSDADAILKRCFG